MIQPFEDATRRNIESALDVAELEQPAFAWNEAAARLHCFRG
jgi:hypothetical protein